jgi:hypothetical protein
VVGAAAGSRNRAAQDVGDRFYAGQGKPEHLPDCLIGFAATPMRIRPFMAGMSPAEQGIGKSSQMRAAAVYGSMPVAGAHRDPEAARAGRQ